MPGTLHLLIVGCVFAGWAAMPANGQEYPSKNIRIIVPFPAGGVLDGIIRAITERIRRNTGHSIVLENRGGAGGAIGLSAISESDWVAKMTLAFFLRSVFSHSRSCWAKV